jgi:hypothetical protein
MSEMRTTAVPFIPPTLHRAIEDAHAVHDATAHSGLYSPEHREMTKALDPLHGGLTDALAGAQEAHEDVRAGKGQ